MKNNRCPKCGKKLDKSGLCSNCDYYEEGIEKNYRFMGMSNTFTSILTVIMGLFYIGFGLFFGYMPYSSSIGQDKSITIFMYLFVLSGLFVCFTGIKAIVDLIVQDNLDDKVTKPLYIFITFLIGCFVYKNIYFIFISILFLLFFIFRFINRNKEDK